MSNLLPRASILLVSYNQESLIKEAFKSLLSQTYENLEIIVADDFSSDTTLSVLKNIAADYQGAIKIIFHESVEN
jgi:glycosyltransferase involved in cell wall biosynthesis